MLEVLQDNGSNFYQDKCLIQITPFLSHQVQGAHTSHTQNPMSMVII